MDNSEFSLSSLLNNRVLLSDAKQSMNPSQQARFDKYLPNPQTASRELHISQLKEFPSSEKNSLDCSIVERAGIEAIVKDIITKNPGMVLSGRPGETSANEKTLKKSNEETVTKSKAFCHNLERSSLSRQEDARKTKILAGLKVAQKQLKELKSKYAEFKWEARMQLMEEKLKLNYETEKALERGIEGLVKKRKRKIVEHSRELKLLELKQDRSRLRNQQSNLKEGLEREAYVDIENKALNTKRIRRVTSETSSAKREVVNQSTEGTKKQKKLEAMIGSRDNEQQKCSPKTQQARECSDNRTQLNDMRTSRKNNIKSSQAIKQENSETKQNPSPVSIGQLSDIGTEKREGPAVNQNPPAVVSNEKLQNYMQENPLASNASINQSASNTKVKKQHQQDDATNLTEDNQLRVGDVTQHHKDTNNNDEVTHFLTSNLKDGENQPDSDDEIESLQLMKGEDLTFSADDGTDSNISLSIDKELNNKDSLRMLDTIPSSLDEASKTSTKAKHKSQPQTITPLGSLQAKTSNNITRSKKKQASASNHHSDLNKPVANTKAVSNLRIDLGHKETLS